MEPGGKTSEAGLSSRAAKLAKLGLRVPSCLKLQTGLKGCQTDKTDLMEPSGKTSESGLKEPGGKTSKTCMRRPSCLKLQNWAAEVPNWQKLG